MWDDEHIFLGDDSMPDGTNDLITYSNYSNLMLLLNATRGIVKNSFPDYLNQFDNCIQGFVSEICKYIVRSLREQGYDDKSLRELMSLSGDCYKEINEIM
jgi:hypothetical protein